MPNVGLAKAEREAITDRKTIAASQARFI